MGDAFRAVAENGPLLLALGAAALAGLVSFLSPCVLPLMPGYLSYVTGLAGSELDAASARGAAGGPAGGAVAVAGDPGGGVAVAGGPAGGGVAVAARSGRRVSGRVLAGTLLFIAGFAVVFTITAVVLTTIGQAMFAHRRPLEIAGGLLIILLGVAFLGLIPGMQREFRIRRLPAAGLLGAPVFGAVFALSWAPCVGPTLGAVLTMAATSGRTDRAVVLALAYCLGLGLPFVVFGLFFHRMLGVFTAIRRNSRWVTRVGGALLMVVGLALITGGWGEFIIWLQSTVGPGTVGI